MLITGYRARIAAIAIALFLVPVTFLFHAFWGAEAAEFQNRLTQFLKNLAVMGGLLMVIFQGGTEACKARHPTLATAS